MKIILLLLMFNSPIEQQIRITYKPLAVKVMREHLIKHPNCQMKDALIVLERMSFHRTFSLRSTEMMGVYPDKENSLLYPTVFVNPNYRGPWNDREIVIALLHESTHLIPTKRDWLCGNDRSNRLMNNIPACSLFGKMQFKSHEITEAIEDHFSRELTNLKTDDIKIYEQTAEQR